jgi:hypothetical protein
MSVARTPQCRASRRGSRVSLEGWAAGLDWMPRISIMPAGVAAAVAAVVTVGLAVDVAETVVVAVVVAVAVVVGGVCRGVAGDKP